MTPKCAHPGCQRAPRPERDGLAHSMCLEHELAAIAAMVRGRRA